MFLYTEPKIIEYGVRLSGATRAHGDTPSCPEGTAHRPIAKGADTHSRVCTVRLVSKDDSIEERKTVLALDVSESGDTTEVIQSHTNQAPIQAEKESAHANSDMDLGTRKQCHQHPAAVSDSTMEDTLQPLPTRPFKPTRASGKCLEHDDDVEQNTVQLYQRESEVSHDSTAGSPSKTKRVDTVSG